MPFFETTSRNRGLKKPAELTGWCSTPPCCSFARHLVGENGHPFEWSSVAHLLITTHSPVFWMSGPQGILSFIHHQLHETPRWRLLKPWIFVAHHSNHGKPGVLVHRSVGTAAKRHEFLPALRSHGHRFCRS